MTNFKDNSGLEEHKPKMSKEERDSMMKKFLAKGGKVEKLEPASVPTPPSKNPLVTVICVVIVSSAILNVLIII